MTDLRYGIRLLRRQPGFAAVAILTMSVGIGATTMLFSVAYGVLLKPLPWSDVAQLVRVTETREGRTGRVVEDHPRRPVRHRAPGDAAGDRGVVERQAVRIEARIDDRIHLRDERLQDPQTAIGDRLGEEFWREILSVNLVGPFRCTRAAAPHLKAARGAVVNTASTAGYAIRAQAWHTPRQKPA